MFINLKFMVGSFISCLSLSLDNVLGYILDILKFFLVEKIVMKRGIVY